MIGRVNTLNNWQFNDAEGSEPSTAGKVLLRVIGLGLFVGAIVVLVVAINLIGPKPVCRQRTAHPAGGRSASGVGRALLRFGNGHNGGLCQPQTELVVAYCRASWDLIRHSRRRPTAGGDGGLGEPRSWP
jgi:hypothetical protein